MNTSLEFRKLYQDMTNENKRKLATYLGVKAPGYISKAYNENRITPEYLKGIKEFIELNDICPAGVVGSQSLDEDSQVKRKYYNGLLELIGSDEF